MGITRASFILFLGNLVGMGGYYLFQVYMSRELAPAEFGIVNALQALFSVIAAPANIFAQSLNRHFGQSFALRKLQTLRRHYSCFSRGLIYFSLAGFGVYYVLSGSVGQFLRIEGAYPLLITGVWIFSFFFLQLNQGFLQGGHRFTSMSLSLGIQGGFRWIFGVLLVVRVLTLDRLERQRDDIERVRRKVPGISVLHGVEVEILPDGSLDFPDRVLASLDVVVASLHDAAGQQPDRLLARYVAAMRHPHVHVITHPANRLVGRHEGYPLDYDALFAAAVETGTAVEVDGAPAHLDLDGHLARRAVAAGATLAFDSECHNPARLGRQMRLGVGTARRGGVEARHVLNARPLPDVLAFFAAKRQRLGG